MSARTLILGGGFGGIAAAVELRRLLGDDHDIVLVDRKPAFTMGLRKLWVLAGHGTIADGSRPRALLARHGVEFVQTEINAIDPSVRRAETSEGWLDGDHLVVALGAVSRPDLVRGLSEHGHDVWSFAGVPAAAEALRAFDGGRIVVLIAGAPYPCPPAPYECALHVHEHLVTRGLRGRTELAVATLQPMLMPNAGRDGSEWMGQHCTARHLVPARREGRAGGARPRRARRRRDALRPADRGSTPPAARGRRRQRAHGGADGSASMRVRSRRPTRASTRWGTSPSSRSRTACHSRRPA